MRHVQRVSAILLRQFYLTRGNIARFLPLIAWVAIDMLLWGFMSRYLNSVASPGYNFIPALLGAVLLWDFFTRVMQGVTMAFLEDVWSRNFLNIFATPLSIREYVSGLVLTSVATSSIGLVVMILMAGVIFGLSFFAYGVLLYPFLITLFLFGIALGIMASALLMRLGPAAEWFVWPIPALVVPFAGVYYPISALPAWMRSISRILPPSYVFENIRTIVGGGHAQAGSIVAALGIALAYVALAAFVFARVYRRAIQTGLIARFSAETLS